MLRENGRRERHVQLCWTLPKVCLCLCVLLEAGQVLARAAARCQDSRRVHWQQTPIIAGGTQRCCCSCPWLHLGAPALALCIGIRIGIRTRE